MAIVSSSLAQAADLGLAPGKPAGVHKANLDGVGVPALVFGGIMVGIVAAIAIASANESTAVISGSTTTTPTTTTTSTTSSTATTA